jgi:hypothetical protein
MRRAAFLFLVILLLAPAAARAATRAIDIPKLFATQLQRAHAQTAVPILLPETMRSDFKHHFPEGRARPGAWRFDIGAARGCDGANACFVAEFSGVRGRSPSAPQTLRLARGRTGYFQPMRCGASCSPAYVEWRERHALYRIQAKFRRNEIVRMANSAIRNGPR